VRELCSLAQPILAKGPNVLGTLDSFSNNGIAEDRLEGGGSWVVASGRGVGKHDTDEARRDVMDASRNNLRPATLESTAAEEVRSRRFCGLLGVSGLTYGLLIVDCSSATGLSSEQ
jgi:hypothetical protein